MLATVEEENDLIWVIDMSAREEEDDCFDTVADDDDDDDGESLAMARMTEANLHLTTNSTLLSSTKTMMILLLLILLIVEPLCTPACCGCRGKGTTDDAPLSLRDLCIHKLQPNGNVAGGYRRLTY